jgi:hypothetical protein
VWREGHGPQVNKNNCGAKGSQRCAARQPSPKAMGPSCLATCRAALALQAGLPQAETWSCLTPTLHIDESHTNSGASSVAARRSQATSAARKWQKEQRSDEVGQAHARRSVPHTLSFTRDVSSQTQLRWRCHIRDLIRTWQSSCWNFVCDSSLTELELCNSKR